MNRFQLQSLLIRVYVGLDFTHHFAEKFGLLGAAARDRVLHYFATVCAHPQEMMTIAGLCEFGAFVGFTFGLCTRVAAVGTALYLVVAMLMGGHQYLGFTWANPGGGWEFPTFWAFICLSYVIVGGGPVSVDRWLWPRLARLRQTDRLDPDTTAGRPA